MSAVSRLPAVLTYLIPVVGWVYVFVFHRTNTLAMYHLRQSIGLFVFLCSALAGWAVIAWFLAWIPYMVVLSMALFALVIVACLCGVVAWILGLSSASRNRLVPLPIFGPWASRLPVR